jgi:hypothetical protein
VTLVYSAHSDGDPDVAWRLLSRPNMWREWAPHMRGAIGLGRPEVRTGTIGFAMLGGLLPLPAAVTDKRTGRSWTWRVGLIRVEHRLRREPEGGCEIEMRLSAPQPIEAALAVSYGPLMGLLVKRLAFKAERLTRRRAQLRP